MRKKCDCNSSKHMAAVFVAFYVHLIDRGIILATDHVAQPMMSDIGEAIKLSSMK